MIKASALQVGTKSIFMIPWMRTRWKRTYGNHTPLQSNIHAQILFHQWWQYLKSRASTEKVACNFTKTTISDFIYSVALNPRLIKSIVDLSILLWRRNMHGALTANLDWVYQLRFFYFKRREAVAMADKLNRIAELYDTMLHNISSERRNWHDFLRFSSIHYR